MAPQERFAVFVKALGVWAFVTGLGTLPLATYNLRQFSDADDFFYMIMETVAEPLVMCIGGVWLIHSNWISRMTFPQSGVTNILLSPDSSQEVATLELFATILKTLGVWYILEGLIQFPRALDYYHRAGLSGFSNWDFHFELFAPCAIAFTFGVLLLIATNQFIKLGFPELLANDDAEEIGSAVFKTSQAVLFAIIVKALGIWFIVNGIAKLPHAITTVIAGIRSDLSSFLLTLSVFGMPVMSIVVGCLCFFATDLFESLAFSKSGSNKATETGDSA